MNLRLWYILWMKEYWERKLYLCLVRRTHKESVKEDQTEHIKGCSEDNPNTGDDRGKERGKTPGTTMRLLSDTILDAMGSGDDECRVTWIKRGRRPIL